MSSLDWEVYCYCKKLVDKCNANRYWSRKMFGTREYPAMAVVCEGCGYIRSAYAYKMFGGRCNPLLLQQIQHFGQIGHRPQGNNNLEQKYPLGNCAEQHAADKVLNAISKRGQNVQLSALQYSIAMRPRTMQRFAACKNCQAILPNVRIL